MKSDDRILELPQPIIDRLREVIQRIRRLQWIKGSLLTLAAAVAAVLAVMAVDAAFSLESLPLRLVLSLSGLLFTAGIAWRYWLRPLCRRISLTAVARWVESRHPELQERISTAVELLGDRHAADDQGSRELLEAVVQDAVADVGRLDPASDLSPRRTRPAKWLAGTAVVVLLILTAIWPGKIPRLLVRAMAPMAETGNAWADQLRVITQSQVVAIGDPLAIEVALSGRSGRVELHLTGPDGGMLVELLQPDPDVSVTAGENGYALRLPAVTGTFTAKVTAGKAVSAPFTITAVPRPEPGPWTLTYHYPDYSGLPDRIQPAASGEITALAGTKVSAVATLNRATAKASVRIGDTSLPDVRIHPDPVGPTVQWSTILTPNLDTFWSLHLEDADGIANRPVELPIRAVADLPPTITLESPAGDRMELRPTEKLPLTYSVKEDIGLSAIQIRVRPQDGAEYLLPPETLPDKSSAAPDEYRGTAILDLAKIVVPEGREIRVSLMAADRLPPDLQGPQRASSREIVIRLNRWTKPLVEKNFEDQHQELREKIEEVKRGLQAAQGRLNDKPERLKREDQLSENSLKDLEAGTAHLQEAETLLKELAERMKDTAYARQSPAMEEIAQQMVQPAKASAQEIPLTDQKETRAELARATKDLLDSAIKQMEQEQKQMEQSREAVQQVAKLSDIAEQQQRLAAEAAQARAGTPPPDAAPPSPGATPPRPAADPQQANAAPTPSDASPPAPGDEQQRQWLEEQRRVAQRARELMEQNKNANPQATQEQLKQAAATAAQLAAEAGALAQKETQLAEALPAAVTPQARAENAAAQQDLANQAAALQAKAKGFQEQSSPQINQSSETQEAAYQAQTQLEQASAQAKQAEDALTAAAQADAAPATPSGTSNPAATPSAGSPAASPAPAPESPAAPSATAATTAEASGTQPGDAPSHPAPAADGNSPPANAGAASTAGTPAPPTPPAGQPAAEASSAALAQAAGSLTSLAGELNTLAGVLAEHSNSLDEGAQQAGTAAEQAASSQNEPGKGPSMQQGAQAAQQAADQLAMAANTAMQAMSIPAGAKTSQSSAASKGQGKPQDGPPNPSQPGQEGKDGLQADTATGLLPAELARLGFTEDDWMKLKSTLKGVDGARSDQIPAEYRDLVKAYFGALAKGNPAP